jgi:aminoglycoside phosphotransferase (APT) family kinase protein
MPQAADHSAPAAAPVEDAIVSFVRGAGLASAATPLRMRRLSGGISSDIWRVETDKAVFCVKRALPKLRVATDWAVPVERNANEAAWFTVVAEFMPEAVPKILAEDAQAGIFAMQYFGEQDYPNWKAGLRAARISLAAAGQVGARLARIHSVTAKSAGIAARFASDDIFHAIRLEPYLLATAQKHPELGARLQQIARTTATTKHALVHGDISPKNILIGPRGPVFIDAECAWWGDPAFDLAFCLNHLLLKCFWVPPATGEFIEAFHTLARAYLAGVDWEPAEVIEARTSQLLAGLFLARVDGKSPAEYVTAERDKDRVRKIASAFLRRPAQNLAAIAEAWRQELGGES